MTDLLAYARRNAIPSLALLLVLAIGIGGGYALAASKTKTITVCADKGTGVLHLKTHGGRCKRGQTRVTWNQVGPQGPQGFQGPAGQPGAAAVSVWANVDNAGSVFSGSRAVRPACGCRHIPGDDHRTAVRSRGKRTRGHASRMRIRPPGAARRAFPVAGIGADRPQSAVHGVHRRRCRRLVHADRSHLHGDGHLHVAERWLEGRSESGVWRSPRRSRPVC